MESVELLHRIERLERSNRKLRRASIAIAASGLLLGLAGMGAPGLCDTLYAERLVLHDPSGNQRIVADAYPGAPTFSVLSREGRALARIGVAQDGEPYLTFFDPKGAEKGTWKGSIPSQARPETKAVPRTDADPRISMK
ncbi:MAG: hypothetical protein ACKVXR_18880 [Planctomycetota bacterium]